MPIHFNTPKNYILRIHIRMNLNYISYYQSVVTKM